MPDESEPSLDQADSMSAENVFNQALKEVGQDDLGPGPAAKPSAEKKPVPKPETLVESEFPEELLTGKKQDESKGGDKAEDSPVEPPAGLSKSNAKNWRDLNDTWSKRLHESKAQMESARAELEALRAKAGSVKDNDETAKALEVMSAEKRELEAEMERIAVERSPQFQQKYTAKEKAIRAEAESILKDAGVDTKLVDAVFAAQGRQRSQLFADTELNEIEKGQIGSLISQYSLLQHEKGETIAHSHEELRRTQEEQKRQRETYQRESEASDERAFSSITKKLEAEMTAARRLSGTDEKSLKWNVDLDERIAAARKASLTPLEPEERAEIHLRAEHSKQLELQVKDLTKVLMATREELAKFRSGAPEIKGGARTARERPVDTSSEELAIHVFEDALAGRLSA